MAGSWHYLALVGVVALGSGAVAPGASSAPTLSPSDLRPEACARCHPGEAETWARSIHSHSHDNPVYRASLRRSGLRWCVDCHSPRLDLGDVDGGPPPRSLGIDCAACHLDKGALLTTRTPSEAGLRAHPLRHSDALGQPEACARCHQFNVPLEFHDPVVLGDQPMQDTLAEWRRSEAPAHGKRCQTCHMASGSHDIWGGHDVELLRKTVRVEFAPSPGDAGAPGWDAVLVARGAGHRVPTGDPFRRFELLYCPTWPCERPGLARFGREFQDEGRRWRLVRDYAAPPEPGPGEARSLPRHLRASSAPGSFDWELHYRTDEPGIDGLAPGDVDTLVSRGHQAPGADADAGR